MKLSIVKVFLRNFVSIIKIFILLILCIFYMFSIHLNYFMNFRVNSYKNFILIAAKLSKILNFIVINYFIFKQCAQTLRK